MHTKGYKKEAKCKATANSGPQSNKFPKESRQKNRTMKTIILILVLACSTYVGLAAPTAQKDLQSLQAMLDKAVQQESDDGGDMELLDAVAQGDDINGEAQGSDPLLAELQNDDDGDLMKIMAAPLCNKKETASAQVTYRNLFHIARHYGYIGHSMLYRIKYYIRRYESTLRHYYNFVRRYN